MIKLLPLATLQKIVPHVQPTVTTVIHDGRPLPVPANDNGSPSPPLDGKARVSSTQVHTGDNMEVLDTLPAESFHAVITDPPYAKNRMHSAEFRETLSSWLTTGDAPPKFGAKTGIDGAAWDGHVPCPTLWKKVFRTLKPGGYLASFMSEEKVDLLVTALRLAGFDVVHVMPWIKGPGWETYADLSKQLQKELKRAANDNSPEIVLGTQTVVNASGLRKSKSLRDLGRETKEMPVIKITQLDALPWLGAKQCVNHAHEFIVIASKPISERNRAENIIKFGTGAMAVGALAKKGRKMASTIDAVFAPVLPASVKARRTTRKLSNRYMDAGLNNPHPCTKPLDLIRWLTKLVCPAGGKILDPFVGSGTGGIAAVLEGRDFVGIEQDAAFSEVARMRIRNATLEAKATTSITSGQTA